MRLVVATTEATTRCEPQIFRRTAREIWKVRIQGEGGINMAAKKKAAKKPAAKKKAAKKR